KSGGGAFGNVVAKSITQLLGAVSGVEAVFNPRAAEGGSDGEPLQRFLERAPASVRHRGRASSADDYAAMVREASSAVAVVKVLPTRNAAGRALPGYLTILIVPSSQEPQPYPSRGLRDEVLRYLEARAPAGLIASGRIFVTGPTYCPVDVAATLVSRRDDEAGSVEARVRAALERFLHPLEGGPSGAGWEFGRGVHRSDVARVIERVEGLDHAESIQLITGDQVRGESVDVPPDQIVAAGKLRLRLKGARS
ncbi:MAG TPA: baseplate J/gp47 family protein, partial [Polyangiaceae bacterium]|nr:baseplate J/gp47 family protein [Polyangiaceae bacterium]